MSSTAVRDAIKNFLTANAPSETLLDLTAQFQEIQDFIAGNGLQPSDDWLGIAFVGETEVPVTFPATNDQGKYRELGAFELIIVSEAKLGVGNALLTRGETLRDLLRGRRIGGVIIESMTPLNFDSGASLRFEGGYMSASFLVSYEYDFDL